MLLSPRVAASVASEDAADNFSSKIMRGYSTYVAVFFACYCENYTSPECQ